jgi:hypothetical protein
MGVVCRSLRHVDARRSRKFLDIHHSPEGQRLRAQEVQQSIAAITADAQARPKLSSDDIRPLVEGFPAGHVMIEARRLAKNVAREKLESRGVKMFEIKTSDINEVANALLETDVSIIQTARANLEKSNLGKRYA